jgi:hypothetical protein
MIVFCVRPSVMVWDSTTAALLMAVPSGWCRVVDITFDQSLIRSRAQSLRDVVSLCKRQFMLHAHMGHISLTLTS